MRRSATFAALALAATSPFAVALDSGGAPPVPAGAYTLDKSHTSLIFRVSHMGFSTYTGRFTNVDAKLNFDPTHLANSRVNVTIDPRSISADNAPSGFLEMLIGKDWLDAAKFPEMAFRSKAVEVTGANTFRVRGELTLHGVTSQSCSTRVTTAATPAIPWIRMRALASRRGASSSVQISACRSASQSPARTWAWAMRSRWFWSRSSTDRRSRSRWGQAPFLENGA